MLLTDVRLLVDRFDECVRFYTAVMELPLRLRTSDAVYAEIDGGRTTLGVYQRRLMSEVVGARYEPDAPRNDFTALTFSVPDIHATYRALRERGAEFLTEPHDQEAWGLRVAHLRDPDGNLIEIYQRL